MPTTRNRTAPTTDATATEQQDPQDPNVQDAELVSEAGQGPVAPGSTNSDPATDPGQDNAPGSVVLTGETAEQIPDGYGRADVPATTAAGSAAQASTGDPVNPEAKDSPTLQYVVAWPKVSVLVDTDAEELTASSGRSVTVEGGQAVLLRGEYVPGEARAGQGHFLGSLGAATAVSVAP